MHPASHLADCAPSPVPAPTASRGFVLRRLSDAGLFPGRPLVLGPASETLPDSGHSPRRMDLPAHCVLPFPVPDRPGAVTSHYDADPPAELYVRLLEGT